MGMAPTLRHERVSRTSRILLGPLYFISHYLAMDSLQHLNKNFSELKRPLSRLEPIFLCPVCALSGLQEAHQTQIETSLVPTIFSQALYGSSRIRCGI